jgi:hypothetical protein
MGAKHCALFGVIESGMKLKTGLQKKVKSISSLGKSTDLAGAVASAEKIVKSGEKVVKGAKGEIQHAGELVAA